MKGGENELKQNLKQFNWLGWAQVLMVFAFAFAPVFFSLHTAQAVSGIPSTPGLCSTGLNCANEGGSKITDWINRIITIILAVTLAVDVLFLIIGGFLYITSAGNEERAKKGKTTVINAIIGLIIIVLAYVIATFVANFFSNQTSTGGNI